MTARTDFRSAPSDPATAGRKECVSTAKTISAAAKARVSTRTSGDAVDCLLERGGRDHRVARGIGTRSGLAYLRAWRGENAADTTGD